MVLLTSTIYMHKHALTHH